MSLNEDMADEVIARAIRLQGYTAGEQAKVISLHREMESELLAKLTRTDPTGVGPTSYQRGRMGKLLKQSQETIRAGYADIRNVSRSGLRNLAREEAQWIAQTSEGQLGINLLTTELSTQQVRELARETLIQGAPSQEWWSRQAGNLNRKFGDQVRQGVLQGEPLETIIRRVRGTAAEGFRNGIMRASRGEAEALVRTSVQTVANQARTEMYQQNSDVVKGIQWLATLDTRTTDICMGLDGLQWDMDYEPVGHPRTYPGPIAHWGCRSTQTAVLKSFDELAGKKVIRTENGGHVDLESRMRSKLAERGWSPGRIDKAVVDARASMDGQVTRDTTFNSWLQRQSPKRQDILLGPGRAELYRRGDITLSQLVDQTGRPLTLSELSNLRPTPSSEPPFEGPTDWQQAMDTLSAKEATGAAYGEESAEAFLERVFEMPKQDLDNALGNLMDDATPYMAINGATLRNQVIKGDGRFKNSLETGKGTFTTIGESRAVKERKIFGITAPTEAHREWPKYGFISSQKEMDNEAIVGWGYGNTYVRFKKQAVANRTTFTVGDSYDGNVFKQDGSPLRVAPAVKLNKPDSRALLSEGREGPTIANQRHRVTSLTKMQGTHGYIEAQMYGDVTLKDIDAVFVSSKKEAKAIQAALTKKGLSDIKVLPLKYDDRLKSLWEQRFYGKEGSQLLASMRPQDFDRLGPGYIEKIANDRLDLLSAYHRNTGKALPENLLGPAKEYKAKPESFSLDKKREFLKNYSAQIQQKEAGALPKIWWEDHRSSLVGWMDDVINDQLLEAYK